MTAAETKYVQLKDTSLWKPSDKSFEETFVSMMAQFNKNQASNNPKKKAKTTSSKPDSKEKKETQQPPFAKHKGKLGDKKEWNGRTYY